MHNYHSALNTFPMGASLGDYNAGSQTTWNDWSAQAMMLPYMEQTALYNAANFMWAPEWSGTMAYTTNSTVVVTIINTFLCPSDAYAGKRGWNSSYAASQGTTTYNINNGSTGIFTYQDAYAIPDISDGTSNTVAYSEFLVNKWDKSGPVIGRSTVISSGTAVGLNAWQIGLVNVMSAATQCQQAFIGGSAGNGPGSNWTTGAMGYTIFNTVMPPNGGGKVTWSACRMDGCCAQAQHAHFVNASSNHPGGVNVLFGDGSVKFLKDTIAINSWWSIGTRNGNEVVSANAYQ